MNGRVCTFFIYFSPSQAKPRPAQPFNHSCFPLSHTACPCLCLASLRFVCAAPVDRPLPPSTCPSLSPASTPIALLSLTITQPSSDIKVLRACPHSRSFLPFTFTSASNRPSESTSTLAFHRRYYNTIVESSDHTRSPDNQPTLALSIPYKSRSTCSLKHSSSRLPLPSRLLRSLSQSLPIYA